MDEKKHIDRLFQEKLKDFEVIPDPAVWKNIESQLTKKKRRIVPFWIRIGSAAAVLLFLISGGIWVFNFENQNKNIQTEEVVPEVEEKIDENKNTSNSNQQEITLQNPKNREEKNKLIKGSSVTNKTDIVLTNKNRLNDQTTSKQVQNQKLINAHQEKLTNKNDTKSSLEVATKVKDENTSGKGELLQLQLENSDEKAVASKNPKKLESLENQKDINQVIEKNKEPPVVDDNQIQEKKWSVGTMVAPVYFNTLSEGSPIDASLAQNNKSTNTSISYGVKVNYKINNRFSIQSGISSVDLDYSTNNVTIQLASSNALTGSTNIDTNIKEVGVVAFSANSAISQNLELAAPQQRGFTNISGDLDQSLSYIEIPLEAKYNLLKRKVGLNVVGGLSTYVLYKNGVFLSNQSGTTTLGEASNINDINFSGNVGLDLDYKINKKLFINVSPMFKYQFNTFSKNDGGFQPYYLGVYSGLNFRF